MRTAIAVTVLALALGCGSSIAPDGAPRRLVRSETSGGLAGFTQSLEVWTDGRVVFDDGLARARWEGVTQPAELARLTALVNGAPFRRLAPEYAPEIRCCDLIGTTLTVDHGTFVQTVFVLDPAGAAPDVLRETRLLLSRIADEVRGR